MSSGIIVTPVIVATKNFIVPHWTVALFRYDKNITSNLQFRNLSVISVSQ
jgi:hypothetical protein